MEAGAGHPQKVSKVECCGDSGMLECHVLSEMLRKVLVLLPHRNMSFAVWFLLRVDGQVPVVACAVYTGVHWGDSC